MIIFLLSPFSSPHIPITPLPTSCVFTYLFNSSPSQCCACGPANEAGKPTSGHALIRNDLPFPRNYLQPTVSQYGAEPQGLLSYYIFFLEIYKSPSFKKIFPQLFFSLGSL